MRAVSEPLDSPGAWWSKAWYGQVSARQWRVGPGGLKLGRAKYARSDCRSVRCRAFHSESLLVDEVSDSSDWRSMTSVSEEAPAASGVSGKHCLHGWSSRSERRKRVNPYGRPHFVRHSAGTAPFSRGSGRWAFRITTYFGGVFKEATLLARLSGLVRSSAKSVSRTNEGRASGVSG